MVYSDIPHFSSCVDDKNREVIMGPGGFPVNGHILTESSLSNMWMPPSSRNSEGNGIEGVSFVLGFLLSHLPLHVFFALLL